MEENKIVLSTKKDETSKVISMQDAINDISKMLAGLSATITSVFASIDYSNAVSAIVEAVDEFCDVLINSGCNKEYVKAYKDWGKDGWSLNTKVDKKFFVTYPGSLEETNLSMSKYCTIDEIKSISSALKETDVCANDLDEAVDAYINGNYKSCAMLLFSLIDRQLLDMGFYNEDGRLKSGCGAICALKKEDEKSFEESTHLIYLQFVLIMRCLIELFQNFDNFKKKPRIINRNFLVHGMWDDKIDEIDCFKVWCALYSIGVVYPELKKKIK